MHPTLTDEIWDLIQRCWGHEPQSRPQMLEVLEAIPGFVSEQLQHIHGLSKSSAEFQLSLDRFYGSAEYKDCVAHLHGAAIEEFVNFLDGVSRQAFVAFTTSDQSFDPQFRFCIFKNYLEDYLRKRYTTCGKYAAIVPYSQGHV